MDPQDGSAPAPAPAPDSAPQQVPRDEPSTGKAGGRSSNTPPVATVAALSIADQPTTTELPESDLASRTIQLLEASSSSIDTAIIKTEPSTTNTTKQADLSMATPVTVFKEVPNTAPESTSETMATPAKTPRICGVCDKEPGKYKCPRCGMSYCSVPCSKIHKASHPADLPPKPPTAPIPQTAGVKRRREPEDPFAVLVDHEADLKRLFEKYPNLEADLCQITAATKPPPDLPATPSNGLPTKYRPSGSARQEEPWTRQVGLRKGVAKLKKMRMDPGEEGDGVREFCEWVVHVLSSDRERREVEAAEVVRRETADEEKGVIRDLLKLDEE